MPGTVICADAENIPFQKNSFDYVTVMAAIYYLNRDKLINEIKKVLKVNGYLFLIQVIVIKIFLMQPEKVMVIIIKLIGSIF